MHTAKCLLNKIASIEVLGLGADADRTHLFKRASLETLIGHAGAGHDEGLVLDLRDPLEGFLLEVLHESKLILLKAEQLVAILDNLAYDLIGMLAQDAIEKGVLSLQGCCFLLPNLNFAILIVSFRRCFPGLGGRELGEDCRRLLVRVVLWLAVLVVELPSVVIRRERVLPQSWA